jgi:hypothetical protein
MDQAKEWAIEQYGSVAFGDVRLTRRAIQIAGQMARRPGSSLPKQMRHWASQKAAYRLLDNEAVTYQALCTPHWEKTRIQAGQDGKTVLMVQDITELDYTGHMETQGLGPIGNHCGQGLMLHNTLAILPEDRRVLGLAYQQVWVREKVSHKQTESKAQRRRRSDRQSSRWGQAVVAIGAPPEGMRWVHVADRESDIYAFFQQTQAIGADFCIRIVQNRRLEVEEATQSEYLLEQLRRLPAMGYRDVDLPASPGHAKRRARLALSWQAVRLHSPRMDAGPGTTFQAWALRTWEEQPAQGIPPLEWLLLTSVPVNHLADAEERLAWYTCRWIVEEYHQCLKTGCAMEQSQLRDGQRLERLLGFLAILAVRMLQLRDLARTHPNQPAIHTVQPILVQIMAQLEHLDPQTMTTQTFWHAVAKIGGFPGRRSDREPGWKRLWDGWLQLLNWVEGARLVANLPPLRDVGNP